MKNATPKTGSVIIQQGKELVNLIRSYSLSQQDLWKKVPYLALEADGRTGFNDDYAIAYTHGLWRLSVRDSSGGYRTGVDLATGKLVELGTTRRKPALDEYVIQLALKMDELDAKVILTGLKEEAKIAYLSYYEPQKQEQWREEKRKRLRLQEIYHRSARQDSQNELEMDPEAYGIEY